MLDRALTMAAGHAARGADRACDGGAWDGGITQESAASDQEGSTAYCRLIGVSKGRADKDTGRADTERADTGTPTVLGKPKRKFLDGNYDTYYNYRNPGASDDPRLEVGYTPIPFRH